MALGRSFALLLTGQQHAVGNTYFPSPDPDGVDPDRFYIPTGETEIQIHPDVASVYVGVVANSTECVGDGWYCNFPAHVATYQCGKPCGAYDIAECDGNAKCYPDRTPADFVWYPRRPLRYQDAYKASMFEDDAAAEAGRQLALGNGEDIFQYDYDGGLFDEGFPTVCNYTWSANASTAQIVDNLLDYTVDPPQKFKAGEENNMLMSFWVMETYMKETPACHALNPGVRYPLWETSNQASITMYGVEGENGVFGQSTFTMAQVNTSCRCTTAYVSTPSMALDTDPSGNEKFVIAAFGEREFRVGMSVFTDARLRDADLYTPGTQFPTESQFFFFVLTHQNKADWSVHLQMSKCYACDDDGFGTECDEEDPETVVFYQCGALLGGPQLTATQSSWLPSYPQYHAVGIQKFRLTDTDTMVLTCNVDGCSERPCDPCRNMEGRRSRRLTQSRGKQAERSMQSVADVNRVNTRLYVPPSRTAPARPLRPNDDAAAKRREEIKRRKALRFSLRVLIVVLFMVALVKAAFRVRAQRAVLQRQIQLAEKARRQRENDKLDAKDGLEMRAAS